VKPNITSAEDQAQLIHKKHSLDGVLVGAGSLKPPGS